MPVVERNPLDAWSRKHAVAMVGACACSVVVGRPWPLSAAALVSFAVLLTQFRGAWTAERRTVVPNLVTGLKLVAVAAMGIFLHGAPGPLLAIVVIGILLLDTLDGWLARRANATTAFGAHFDMESDAVFILAVNVELLTRGQLGLWILSAGLLRYVYVLITGLVPPRGGQVPRSKVGRNAFGTLVVGLVAALAWPHALGAVAAAVGSTAVVLSFVGSFYWSYLRRDAQGEDAATGAGTCEGR